MPHQPSLGDRDALTRAFDSLRGDLIHDDGPRISTMRNYRFAIVQYDPQHEFELRDHAQRLSAELTAHGWVILPLDLHAMLLQRVRDSGPRWAERVIAMEERMADRDPARALGYLSNKLIPLIEGPDGIAADCAAAIDAHVAAHPDLVERTLVLVGRLGALYPFFRSSALLRHLDGNTHNVPVVLLYPGARSGSTGLSFMGELPPDNDYRPRIYP